VLRAGFVCLWTAVQFNYPSRFPWSLRANFFYFECDRGQTQVFQNVASHLFWRWTVLERPKVFGNVLSKYQGGRQWG